MQVQDVMEQKRSVDRPIDGRRQRTVDSRARIVSAMLELTHAGHISVSAELVAERANVGLRTVFRHFNDMDLPPMLAPLDLNQPAATPVRAD